MKRHLALLPLLLLLSIATRAQVVAFPGAQGGGAASVGGRGGVVFEVTNLNDSGAGSLRACVIASGPRTCVFRTGGTITLLSALIVTNPFLTIAGQTAPGGGIQVIGTGITISPTHTLQINTHDVIVRYMKFRPGFNSLDGAGSGDGSAVLVGNFGDGYNIMIDHCSLELAHGESYVTFSNDQSGKHNQTLSWSIAGLMLGDHPTAILSGANDLTGTASMIDIDFHHNLIGVATHRNPLLKGQNSRFVNNLVYDWFYYSSLGGGGIALDYINNIYKAGPMFTGTGSASGWEITSYWNQTCNSDCGPNSQPSVYMSGNIGPNDPTAANNAANMYRQDSAEGPGTISPAPSAWVRGTPQSAPATGTAITAGPTATLASSVTGGVGASQKLSDTACDGTFVSNRDSLDTLMVGYFNNATGPTTGTAYGGGHVPTTQADVGGFPTLVAGTACASTLHDGIADAWKTKYGLSTSDPNLYKTTAPNGYTYLESYLGGLSPTGSNVYYAQTAAGAGNGADCADAKALPILIGDQIPGITIHLCGTITGALSATGITVGASGTTGNPITFLFEPGAVMTSAAWGAAFTMSNKSNIVIDGGTNGVIQNTANGSLLANQLGTGGVSVTCGSNIEIKNLSFINMYVHVPSGEDGGSSGAISVNSCASPQSGLHFHNLTIHDAHSGIFVQYGPGFSNSEFDHNTISNIVWGIALLDNNNGSTATGVLVHDNDIHDFANWFDGAFNFHFDGIFFSAFAPSTTFTSSSIWNNHVWGSTNVNGTGYIFLSGSGGGMFGINVFNNLLGAPVSILSPPTPAGSPEAHIVMGFGPHNVNFLNNTMVGIAQGAPQNCIRIRDSGASGIVLQNNICSNAVSAIDLYAGNTVSAANYNLYDLPSAFKNLQYFVHPDGTFQATFAAWISATGLDTPNSVSAAPLLNSSTFVPQSGSPALNMGSGTNLSSQCTGQLVPLCFDKPQVVGAGASGTGNARPATGQWTVGAYQVVSGSVAPAAPTGLTGTVSGSTVSLLWTASAGTPAPTAYTEYRGTVHGGPYVAVKSGITSTSVTDTPVNGTYFYVVTAFVGGVVSSINGNGSTATVTCAAACTFPSGTAFTIAGDSTVAFNGTFTSTGQPTSTTFTFASSTSGSGTGGGAWQSGAESAKSNEITVTTPATLTVSLLPASRVFASTIVGSPSASQSVTLTNTSGSGGTVTISSKSITGPNAGDFSFTDNCPSLLLSTVSCTFNITFLPTAPGARSANLTVVDNATGSPQTVALSGTGVAQTPVVTLSPTSLNFGDQSVSTTSTVRSIILTNTGSGTLTVSSVAASGDFAVTTVPSTNCGGTLAPLATCSLNVTFTPTATGGRTGAVTVTDNAAGSPHVATLTGNGITIKCAMTGNVTLSGAGSVCQ